jgi:hypothetical protein
MAIQVECMYGVTGDTRHPVYTPADYVVRRVTATAQDHKCRQCLLALLRTVDGEEVLSIDMHRTPNTAYDRQRHAEVLRLHSLRTWDRKMREAMRE